MRFAYADPPYPGQAVRHYKNGGTAARKLGKDPDAAEVDYGLLVARLENEYPDGWALSCSSSALWSVMFLLPPDIRTAAWVKPFAVFKPNVNPAYTWEPVFFKGGRKRGRDCPTVKDHLIESITLRKGLVGAKPERFCQWVLDLLGYESGDEIVDLFPGTGVMQKVASREKGDSASAPQLPLPQPE